MWNILLFFKLTPASFYFYSSQYGNYLNEKKFEKWVKLSDGGRKYFYDVVGRHGWRARYVKEVDSNENTLNFIRKYIMNLADWLKFMKNFRSIWAIRKLTEVRNYDYWS